MGDDTANPLPILPLPVQRRLVERGSQKGKGIAVFTSGGDSQGMNAAVRAVVRFEYFLSIFIVDKPKAKVQSKSQIPGLGLSLKS